MQTSEILARFNIRAFAVGHIFHPVQTDLNGNIRPVFRRVSIRHPMRLNAMLLDYSNFIAPSRDQWSRAGSVPFAIEEACEVDVELSGPDHTVVFQGNPGRISVALHAVRIMQKALDVNDGLVVTIRHETDRLHVGLGSSPTLQSAIAYAVNVLYGSRIPSAALVRYLISNYGEEIPGDDNHLIPVQAMGAAAAVGLQGGGMLVLSGYATTIARMEIPKTYKVVIATPRYGYHKDAATELSKDIPTYRILRGVSSSRKHRIAYDVLNRMIPAMIDGNLREVGAVIEYNRLSDKQIERYDARYPEFTGMPRVLRDLYRDGAADVVSISSTGPTLFALTTSPLSVFRSLEIGGQMEIFVTTPNNAGAVVTKWS